jgi:hypothetical protein
MSPSFSSLISICCQIETRKRSTPQLISVSDGDLFSNDLQNHNSADVSEPKQTLISNHQSLLASLQIIEVEELLFNIASFIPSYYTSHPSSAFSSQTMTPLLSHVSSLITFSSTTTDFSPTSYSSPFSHYVSSIIKGTLNTSSSSTTSYSTNSFNTPNINLHNITCSSPSTAAYYFFDKTLRQSIREILRLQWDIEQLCGYITSFEYVRPLCGGVWSVDAALRPTLDHGFGGLKIGLQCQGGSSFPPILSSSDSCFGDFLLFIYNSVLPINNLNVSTLGGGSKMIFNNSECSMDEFFGDLPPSTPLENKTIVEFLLHNLYIYLSHNSKSWFSKTLSQDNSLPIEGFELSPLKYIAEFIALVVKNIFSYYPYFRGSIFFNSVSVPPSYSNPFASSALMPNYPEDEVGGASVRFRESSAVQ